MGLRHTHLSVCILSFYHFFVFGFYLATVLSFAFLWFLFCLCFRDFFFPFFCNSNCLFPFSCLFFQPLCSLLFWSSVSHLCSPCPCCCLYCSHPCPACLPFLLVFGFVFYLHCPPTSLHCTHAAPHCPHMPYAPPNAFFIFLPSSLFSCTSLLLFPLSLLVLLSLAFPPSLPLSLLPPLLNMCKDPLAYQ